MARRSSPGSLVLALAMQAPGGRRLQSLRSHLQPAENGRGNNLASGATGQGLSQLATTACSGSRLGLLDGQVRVGFNWCQAQRHDVSLTADGGSRSTEVVTARYGRQRRLADEFSLHIR